MRKIILIGRSGAGKTTLTQALKGEEIRYHKTQYVNYFESIIDTPGEYAQTHELGYALALYSYEADVVGLLLSAEEPFSLYPPNITCMVNREVVGIITHIDSAKADPERAERWLRLSGCRKIFRVNSTTGEGVSDILDYLKEEGDAPGGSSNAPGESSDAPDESSDAPGESSDAPDRSGDTPGGSDDTPGKQMWKTETITEKS